MLYYLFDWLRELNFPGAGLFHYISFRAVCALALSFLITLLAGPRVIEILRKKTRGEQERDLGLPGQENKAATPKMGGILIIVSLLIPVLLFNKLDNIYVLLMIFTTLWLGVLGFADDYIKCVKHNITTAVAASATTRQNREWTKSGTWVMCSPQVSPCWFR